MHEMVTPQLKQFLVKDLFVELPPSAIGLDDGLQTVVGLDSICFIELRLLIEDFFKIRIDDSEFTPEHFRSLSALASLIESKLDEAGAEHA